MSDENRCRACSHFKRWRYAFVVRGHPEGVCTAPRPICIPAGNREVCAHHGAGCQAFEAKAKGEVDDGTV